MNQNEEIRVLYVQPGKYPEEIKIPNTLETFQKYVCGSIESVRLDRDAYIICNDEGKLLPLPPNRLYGPTDFFADHNCADCHNSPQILRTHLVTVLSFDPEILPVMSVLFPYPAPQISFITA